ncbi:MAG: amidohydrolase, partial [Pseudonocardiales bacterium]
MTTTIGLEEHAWIPDLRDALVNAPATTRDDSLAMFNRGERLTRLLDLGDQRIRHMDNAGIDVQVLSITTPGTQSLPPSDAIRLARDANDQLAAAVAAHP